VPQGPQSRWRWKSCSDVGANRQQQRISATSEGPLADADAGNVMNVSGEDIRSAQMITGAAFALFLMVGFIPGLQPYSARIRLAIAVAYFAAAAGFMVYLMVR
jgi:hypothetical protein